MGEQVGITVTGSLYYVPRKEFKRILSLDLSAIEKTSLFASLCRINTLYMIARAGSGHLGTSFSSMDIISWLLLNELYLNDEHDNNSTRNIFFSSKGHDAPALYNNFIGLGKLDFNLIHKLRSLGGLPGHPDINTPNIITNTGSLGMGISKAKGMIIANRLKKCAVNVYVLTGDGELQEGQFWESLISASNDNLHELVVIIDHNKLQSDTLVTKVSNLGDLEVKLRSFGWYVIRCEGNELAAFSKALVASKTVKDKPKVIIADTIKGKGVTFMEHTSIDSNIDLYKYHSGAPNEEEYFKAVQELIDTTNSLLNSAGQHDIELETVIIPSKVFHKNLQHLIKAYSEELIKQARNNSKIVALDADLILDTGLIPFQSEFPDRLIECGIAEQDMVSQAGGMALEGMIPIVHSFSCFLSARSNEQIYNNASEKTKIIYVGSLAGVIPGGPGHSHQAVRDISSLAAIPGLCLMEPCCEEEVGMLLNWAINNNNSSSYLRLVSVPINIPYKLPENYKPEFGKGVALSEGNDAIIIAYGPVMLSISFEVASLFQQRSSKLIKVINLPWLKDINEKWLVNEVAKYNLVVCLDNHYIEGGQGGRITEILSNKSDGNKKIIRIGLKDFPVCGTNEEVLHEHSMNSEYIYSTMNKVINILK